MAIAAWARVDDLSRDGVVASVDGGIGEAGLILGYRSTSATSGQWVLSMPDMPMGAFTSWEAVGGVVTASNQDEWVHLVGVWNDYTGQMTLYLNGAEVASAQRQSTWWGDGTVQIGRANFGGFWDDQFSGEIADVRVFDRVVPSGEAEQLGWQVAHRQGLWQFNSVGDTGSPEFGGGPEAVLTGGANLYIQHDSDFDPPALIGDGHLELDGVDGAAVVGDPVADTARSFSISARVRLDTESASGPMTVFSIPGVNASAVEVVYIPDCDGLANACWRLRVAETDAADADLISVDGALAPSDATEGQELTVVFDATTGQVRLYVNGAAAAAGDDDLLLASWSATGDLTVGYSDTGGYFAGVIDDVRVYSGVASERDRPTRRAAERRSPRDLTPPLRPSFGKEPPMPALHLDTLDARADLAAARSRFGVIAATAALLGGFAVGGLDLPYLAEVPTAPGADDPAEGIEAEVEARDGNDLAADGPVEASWPEADTMVFDLSEGSANGELGAYRSPSLRSTATVRSGSSSGSCRPRRPRRRGFPGCCWRWPPTAAGSTSAWTTLPWPRTTVAPTDPA
ncbi:hypothetical protein GCM10029992_25410 [Glycomyces albus]